MIQISRRSAAAPRKVGVLGTRRPTRPCFAWCPVGARPPQPPRPSPLASRPSLFGPARLLLVASTLLGAYALPLFAAGEQRQAPGAAAPATSADPIYFRTGSVLEYAPEVLIPGPAVPWAQHAVYDSRASGTTKLGGKWFSDMDTRRLYDAGGGNVALSPDITSSQVFRDTGGGRYTAPVDGMFTLEKCRDGTQGCFRLTNTLSGDVYIYLDFAGANRGLLLERTTREWQAANKEGIRYTYHDEHYGDERVKQVTTPEGQDYNVLFSYCGSGVRTKLRKIEVREPDSTLVRKIEYTYFAPGIHSSDVGSQDDLIQAEFSGPDEEGNWVTNCFQYRYDAVTGHLKAVLEPEAIRQIIKERADISSPADILAKRDDEEDVGSGSAARQSHKTMQYASRWYTYYSVDLKTDNSGLGTRQDPKCVTCWAPGGEDLEGTYGAANVVEVDPPRRINLVKSQLLRSPVSAVHDYFHLKIDQGPQPDNNDVTCLVIEDTMNREAKPLYRTIYGINESGRSLREVRITDPTGSPQFSCQSWTFINDAGIMRHHVAEYRTSAAHKVNSNADLRRFLDPSGNGGSNDTDTLHDSVGEIRIFEYGSDGTPTAAKTKTGRAGEPANAPAPEE